MTLFFVNYGFKPDLPSTLGSAILDAQQHAQQLKDIIQLVHKNIVQAQEHTLKYHDANRTEISFQPDHKLLISHELATPEYLQSPEGKKSLGDQWFGPFTVVRAVGSGPNAYELKLPASYKLHL
ncbi:hypothetical protein GGH14_004077, partial [Coemansia sp. RSA 370]